MDRINAGVQATWRGMVEGAISRPEDVEAALEASRRPRGVTSAHEGEKVRFLSVFKWERRKGWDVLLRAVLAAGAAHPFAPVEGPRLAAGLEAVIEGEGGAMGQGRGVEGVFDRGVTSTRSRETLWDRMKRAKLARAKDQDQGKSKGGTGDHGYAQ